MGCQQIIGFYDRISVKLGFNQSAQLLYALVVVVEGFHFGQIVQSSLVVAQTEMAEGKHVLAVNDVLGVELCMSVLSASFPDEQVGQRNGEIIHGLLFEDVLFAVVDEFVETSSCLILTAEPAQGQSLVEYLFGLGVVVV